MAGPPEWVAYYQVSWRSLPSELCVRSFDGTLTPEEEAALLDATALWVERVDRAVDVREEELTIPVGGVEVLDVAEPGVLREVALEMLDGELASIEAALVVDGETVVEAPAARWLHAAPSVDGFASALASGDATGGSMEYPTPVRRDASLTLRNVGTESVVLRARLGVDPGVPDASLGALRIECSAPVGEETGENIRLLDLRGMRGHYAGQWLVMDARNWGWSMMEGDHEVIVDGEPRLLGTGVEDYFGGAFYYLAGPYALPFIGAPGFDLQGGEHLRTNPIDVAQYRHHVLSGVPFESSFAFEYEMAAPETLYEHCSYWYVDADEDVVGEDDEEE